MSLEPGLTALLKIPEFQLSRPPPGVTAAVLRAARAPMPPFPVDPVHEMRDIEIPVPGRCGRRTRLPPGRGATPAAHRPLPWRRIRLLRPRHSRAPVPDARSAVWLRGRLGGLSPRAGASLPGSARGLLPRHPMAGRPRQRAARRCRPARGRRRQRWRESRDGRVPPRPRATRRADCVTRRSSTR